MFVFRATAYHSHEWSPLLWAIICKHEIERFALHKTRLDDFQRDKHLCRLLAADLVISWLQDVSNKSQVWTNDFAQRSSLSRCPAATSTRMRISASTASTFSSFREEIHYMTKIFPEFYHVCIFHLPFWSAQRFRQCLKNSLGETSFVYMRDWMMICPAIFGAPPLISCGLGWSCLRPGGHITRCNMNILPGLQQPMPSQDSFRICLTCVICVVPMIDFVEFLCHEEVGQFLDNGLTLLQYRTRCKETFQALAVSKLTTCFRKACESM